MPKLNTKRLTKKIVDGLTVPAGKRELIVHDTSPRGFGVRVKASGTRTYFVKYRVGGRTKRYALAQHGEMTLDEARAMAERTLGEVRNGADPSESRSGARKVQTLKAFVERYFEQHADVKKKPRSAKEDRRILNVYVLPTLGNHRVTDIDRGDVTDLFHEIGRKQVDFGGKQVGGETQANRALSLLSKLFNLAERWGIRPDGTNPCRHVERYRETKRERYLDAGELKKLGEALTAIEEAGEVWPTVVPLVRLLLLTGARLDEIRTARWEYVDWNAGLLRLPDSKTGRKTIELSPQATEVLQRIERQEDNPHVIYGRVKGAPLVNVKDPWKTILERAKLTDLRPHDLRHTFASYAVSGGYSLELAGSLLGHSQAATTKRYAHLHRSPRAQAAARVAGEIAAAMTPKSQAAKVVSIGQAKK